MSIRGKIAIKLLGIKEGFDMAANKKFVADYQYWSEDKRYEYHNTRLRQIIRHAYDNVPYYHDMMVQCGLTPEDIRCKADLAKLPITRKADIIAHKEDFKARNFNDFHPVAHYTGGTTGIPCAYYNDRAAWAMNWAVKMTVFEAAGYHYGDDRLGVLAGGSLIKGKNTGLKHNIWRFLNNYYSMPITHMDEACMTEYYENMKKQNIRFLRGYPSSVYTFAEFLRGHGLSLPLNAVFTTAEMLYPHQRKLMEEVFCCRVWDAYGCGDGMGNASDCELHTGMHIYDVVSIMQIVDVDGRDVKADEEGEIVLTSLYDYAFPLIRYAPGDRAIASNHKCTCGRTLPIVEKIIGRTSDVFKLPNGRVLNGLSLPFEDLTSTLKCFQLIQEKMDYVRLLLVPKSDITEKQLSEYKNLIEYHCGEGVKVSVEVVDNIEVPVSGKLRYIISKVS